MAGQLVVQLFVHLVIEDVVLRQSDPVRNSVESLRIYGSPVILEHAERFVYFRDAAHGFQVLVFRGLRLVQVVVDVVHDRSEAVARAYEPIVVVTEHPHRSGTVQVLGVVVGPVACSVVIYEILHVASVRLRFGRHGAARGIVEIAHRVQKHVLRFGLPDGVGIGVQLAQLVLAAGKGERGQTADQIFC